jgi:DNA-directed RNA polymerase subunit K/omega
MNINAIPISVLFRDDEDLYEKIVVGALRQRQIIDSRSLQLEAFQDIEDTEQLEQFDDIDHDIEKPISIAMEELLSNDLEWRHTSDEKESE